MPITKQDFKESFERAFSPIERSNEVIVIVYRLLITALISRQYDTLIVTPAYFTWCKKDQVASQFQLDSCSPTTMTYLEALETIIARDELIQRHVQIVSRKPQETIYRLLPD